VIEGFLLAPWPECPVRRPAGRPLRTAVVGRSAVWACPTENAIIATVGHVPRE
jgi:hypothetical protein